MQSGLFPIFLKMLILQFKSFYTTVCKKLKLNRFPVVCCSFQSKCCVHHHVEVARDHSIIGRHIVIICTCPRQVSMWRNPRSECWPHVYRRWRWWWWWRREDGGISASINETSTPLLLSHRHTPLWLPLMMDWKEELTQECRGQWKPPGACLFWRPSC